MGPLYNRVTWYGINYAGMQITQWDFQNKGKSGWTGTISFVLEVPLHHMNSLGNPGATSRDDAIFSGKRYFWAKVYFKSWRAPGILLLPNQFRKWSNSVPQIGQKKIFLTNQRGVLAG